MSWSWQKKKEGILCAVYFSGRNFFNICFISMYSILHTLSENTYFYISKSIISYAFFLFLEIIKSFQCILMEIMSIAQFDNTKILIGSDDKLPELFLEDALYVK